MSACDTAKTPPVQRDLVQGTQSVLKVYKVLYEICTVATDPATADYYRLLTLPVNMMALGVLEQLQTPFGT